MRSSVRCASRSGHGALVLDACPTGILGRRALAFLADQLIPLLTKIFLDLIDFSQRLFLHV